MAGGDRHRGAGLQPACASGGRRRCAGFGLAALCLVLGARPAGADFGPATRSDHRLSTLCWAFFGRWPGPATPGPRLWPDGRGAPLPHGRHSGGARPGRPSGVPWARVRPAEAVTLDGADRACGRGLHGHDAADLCPALGAPPAHRHGPVPLAAAQHPGAARGAAGRRADSEPFSHLGVGGRGGHHGPGDLRRHGSPVGGSRPDHAGRHNAAAVHAL